MAGNTARRRKQAAHTTRLFHSYTRFQQAVLEAMDQQAERYHLMHSRNTDLIYYSPEPVTLLVPETPSNKTCYLLDLLPPELRNIIYQYALNEHSGEVILRLPYRHLNIFGIEQKAAQHDKNNAFALQYTCKQIWDECSDLIYQYNTIKFKHNVDGISNLSGQLNQIAEKQYKNRKLRRVHLDLGYMGSFEREWNRIAGPMFWLAQNTLQVEISFRKEFGSVKEAVWNVKVYGCLLKEVVTPARRVVNAIFWQKKADEIMAIMVKTFSTSQK
ncbi:hypothetical protein HII31_06022 [Pseudocercospora fuligena]|uniref:Uncharacterized protein n=1 Tax=Pseudocercospora fuligena TaxID=685502 RepID=A0A8H6RK79_9PEZI|nr:hypothetical protein HII31_06022 [Pseudocercospora fuligena]